MNNEHRMIRMKTLFLSILLLSGMMTVAQTGISEGNCKAFFKYEVNNKMMFPYAATAINFYDLSDGKVKEWYWDSGDGATSREQNPMFIFKHPVSSPNVKINPYRTVSLTILTDNCKSLYSETINIMNGTAYVPPVCKAGFSSYPVSVDSLKGTATVQLINLSEGDSLSFLWHFDDGKTTAEREPKITFSLKPAKQLVCLTVSGKNKCIEKYCDSVWVNPPVIKKPEECFAYFGYSVNYTIKTFAPALVLDFYPKVPPDFKELKWVFGDGTSSAELNPTHIFNFPLGKDSLSSNKSLFRKVSLTVVTKSGCVASWSDSINIYMGTSKPVDPVPVCHAWFKYHQAAGVTVAGVVPYQFFDASEGKVIRRLWQFENGETSDQPQPLIKFNLLKPTQKVCLTIYTTDSCKNTWCETVYVSDMRTDIGSSNNPGCPYKMRITSNFPIMMSSCAGTAHAQVCLKDSLVKADNYAWSDGTLGQDAKNLCPTRTYTVKAVTPDGCGVSSTFVFNAIGPVTEIPVSWWLSGPSYNQVVNCSITNKNYTVEWRLCDGTTVKSDTIPLNAINCEFTGSNMILKDSAGNVIYSERVSLKSSITGIRSSKIESLITLFPNPVNEILHVQYSGEHLNQLYMEICDISGRRISGQEFRDIEPGQLFNLDVSSLGKGIYLCKMILDQQYLVVEKFSK